MIAKQKYKIHPLPLLDPTRNKPRQQTRLTPCRATQVRLKHRQALTYQITITIQIPMAIRYIRQLTLILSPLGPQRAVKTVRIALVKVGKARVPIMAV